MFKYEIYYRLDDGEYFETSSQEIEGDSIESIYEKIKNIEKRHTIISVKNLSMCVDI